MSTVREHVDEEEWGLLATPMDDGGAAECAHPTALVRGMRSELQRRTGLVSTRELVRAGSTSSGGRLVGTWAEHLAAGSRDDAVVAGTARTLGDMAHVGGVPGA